MATQKQREFCKAVYKAAVELNEINPVFVAAQACLETGWGAHVIGKYNLFGITKGSNWPASRCVLVLTSEVFSNDKVRFNAPEKVVSITKTSTGKYRYKVYRLFKDFKSYKECLEEHLRIFKKSGYADAWPYRKNAREFAKRIADNKGCKYATDPNYAKTMGAMIASVERVIGS